MYLHHQFALVMQRECGLLGCAFEGDKLHTLLLHSQPDASGIAGIGLVACDEWEYALGWYQQDLMAKFLKFTCPAVRTYAGFDAYHAVFCVTIHTGSPFGVSANFGLPHLGTLMPYPLGYPPAHLPHLIDSCFILMLLLTTYSP